MSNPILELSSLPGANFPYKTPQVKIVYCTPVFGNAQASPAQSFCLDLGSPQRDEHLVGSEVWYVFTSLASGSGNRYEVKQDLLCAMRLGDKDVVGSCTTSRLRRPYRVEYIKCLRRHAGAQSWAHPYLSQEQKVDSYLFATLIRSRWHSKVLRPGSETRHLTSVACIRKWNLCIHHACWQQALTGQLILKGRQLGLSNTVLIMNPKTGQRSSSCRYHKIQAEIEARCRRSLHCSHWWHYPTSLRSFRSICHAWSAKALYSCW